jgi:hypothetical protein
MLRIITEPWSARTETETNSGTVQQSGNSGKRIACPEIIDQVRLFGIARWWITPKNSTNSPLIYSNSR